MENACVICPECGKEIPFNAFNNAHDIEYNAWGHFWEKLDYTCNECETEFSVTAQYSLKFEKIVP